MGKGGVGGLANTASETCKTTDEAKAAADLTKDAPVATAEGAAAAAPAVADGAAAAAASDEAGPAADAPVEDDFPEIDPATIVIPLPYLENEDGTKAPLAGVQSIFVTDSTKKIVGCEELGPNNPQMKVKKSVILEDIRFRGAISDFKVIQKDLEDSPMDEIIFRHNEDDTYGDGNNLEVCVGPEANSVWEKIAEATELKARAEKRIADRIAAEKAIPKSKRKKKRTLQPWQSLGSEIEIDETHVRSTREPVEMVFHKPHKEFGLAFEFNDKDASDLWNSSQMECRPFRDPNFELVKVEFDVGVQAVPTLADSTCQATKNRCANAAFQYEARVSSAVSSSTTTATTTAAATTAPKFQSNPMDSAIVPFLDRVKPLYENALQQNEIFDIFEDKFGQLAEDDSGPGNKNENAITEFQSFTYWKYSNNKVASCIDWVTGYDNVVAVAITEPLSFNQRLVSLAGKPRTSYILIWSFSDPIHPQYVLESPFDIYAFQFNPKHEGIVAAGCYNGQVVLWDVSKAKEDFGSGGKQGGTGTTEEDTNITTIAPIVISSIDSSHSMCINDLVWLPSGVEVTKNGKVEAAPEGEGQAACNFFATTSVDGRVMFWDQRVMSKDKPGAGDKDAPPRRGRDSEAEWKPVWSIGLVREMGGDLATTKLSFNLKDPFSTTFFAGSMDGEIAYADYLQPDNVSHPEYTKMSLDAHHGAICSLQRSPFFEDTILSVGGWSFKIWKEGLSSPIFASAEAGTYLTMGCWSPTRPGVIITARQDGMVEVWDLLDRSHEASIIASVSSNAITSMRFYDKAEKATAATTQLLAVGDSMGKLHILELPRNLRRPIPNEKDLMTAFCDRELDRVKYVDTTLVSFEGMEFTSGPSLSAGNTMDLSGGVGEDDGDFGQAASILDLISQSENDYLKLEREFREKFNVGGEVQVK